MGYGQLPPGYGPQQFGPGQLPPGFDGAPQPGVGQVPPGYGAAPAGYGPMPPGYGQMPMGQGRFPPVPVGAVPAQYAMPVGGGLQPASSTGTFPPAPIPAPAVSADPSVSMGYAPASGSSCSSCDSCTACDSCDDCGHPDCACDCDSGLLSTLFGPGSCLFGSCGLADGSHSGHLSYLFGDGSPRPDRIYGGVEWLYWWNKNRYAPALATTSVPGTDYADAGVEGLTSTSVLFGGDYDADDDGESGIRGTLGLWFDRRQTCGVFARAFQFGSEDINFTAASPGNTILARPFYNASLDQEGSLVVSYPGISRGRIDIRTAMEITGYEVLFRKLLYYGECNRLDFVSGYHGTQVDDSISISHVLVSQDPQGRVPVGTQLSTTDAFDVENEFNGGTIGLMAQGYDGRLTWNLLTKLSLGNTTETVTIRGVSTTAIPGAGSANFDQGLLALDTNSGIYEQDKFTLIPELDVSVMYHLTGRLQFSVGYSAIYWSNVALAGNAIDRVINPTQIAGPLVGPARPAFTFSDEGYWVQGLTFGLHGRF